MQRLEIEKTPGGMQRSGARFGKYRLVRELAVGGMARLFLATIDGPGGFAKRCVVKKILPEHAASQEFSRMFVNEARVAALLHHPGIVQIFDFGEVNGEYYIAMEFVDGGSLEEVLRRAFEQKVVPGPRIATRIGIDLADALAYVHNACGPDGSNLKLVHRDLTPGNVLVSREGAIKITDFGVVKTVINHAHTQVGVVKGKFAYMAPEQIRDDAIDHRTDLFALGIVLYETATGRFLFRRAQLAETVNAVARADVPKPSSFIPNFPPELERILLRCLAGDRNQRYQRAEEINADLEAFRAREQWTSAGQDVIDMLVRFVGPRTEDPFTSGITSAPVSAPVAMPLSAPMVAPEVVHEIDDVEVEADTEAPSRPDKAVSNVAAKLEALRRAKYGGSVNREWRTWALIVLAMLGAFALGAILR